MDKAKMTKTERHYYNTGRSIGEAEGRADEKAKALKELANLLDQMRPTKTSNNRRECDGCRDFIQAVIRAYRGK